MSYQPPKPDTIPPLGARPGAPASNVPDRLELTTEDLRFVNELSAVGLLDELHGDELMRIAAVLEGSDGPPRQLDLLCAYYDASRDLETSERRRRRDRFYMLSDEDAVSAPFIVARLAQLHPELGDEVILERIGGEGGPLVLRAGDHVAGVVDEYEESLDTDEIDLRDVEGEETITLRGIVQAFNTLLSRFGAEHRLVPLLGDASREAYVAATKDGALELYRSGFLELEDKAELEEHCSFG